MALDVRPAAVGERPSPGRAGVVDEQVQPPMALEEVLADARRRAYDDGIVHDQPDGEHDGQERQEVETEAKKLHEKQSADQ